MKRRWWRRTPMSILLDDELDEDNRSYSRLSKPGTIKVQQALFSSAHHRLFFAGTVEMERNMPNIRWGSQSASRWWQNCTVARKWVRAETVGSVSLV